ncbi:hypothetical protein WMY93_033000 [Mugilogobius chulae]|uniref:Uncharacterized protein n=1 Tax=Mugilogobius chulae TaxID=88201 RepID=A0AAW0MJT7_9GOBI
MWGQRRSCGVEVTRLEAAGPLLAARSQTAELGEPFPERPCGSGHRSSSHTCASSAASHPEERTQLIGRELSRNNKTNTSSSHPTDGTVETRTALTLSLQT